MKVLTRAWWVDTLRTLMVAVGTVLMCLGGLMVFAVWKVAHAATLPDECIGKVVYHGKPTTPEQVKCTRWAAAAGDTQAQRSWRRHLGYKPSTSPQVIDSYASPDGLPYHVRRSEVYQPPWYERAWDWLVDFAPWWGAGLLLVWMFDLTNTRERRHQEVLEAIRSGRNG